MKRPGIIAGAILCALYILLTIAVQNRLFYSLDVQTELILQSIVPRIVDTPFSILSLVGTAEVTIPLFILIFFLARPSWRLPLVFFFGLVVLGGISGKMMVDQPGPSPELVRYVFQTSLLSGGIITPYSYPSGHAGRWSVLTVFAIGLVATSRASERIKQIAIAALVLVEATMLFSRVYLGEHWLTDVIGGAFLGVGLGMFVFDRMIARE